MSKRMYLRKVEMVRLIELCDKFGVDQLQVQYNEGGGIGYTLDAFINVQMHDETGEFKIEITGTNNW